MAGLGTTTANNVLKHILGQESWTQPAAVWVSLHTADPGGTGVNEVSAGWYGRQQPASGWNAATITGATNNGQISWNAVTGSNVTVTHVGLWDASTGGTFLLGIDVSDKLFVVGAVPKINDAAMTVVPGAAYSNYLIPLITDHMLGGPAMTFDTTLFLALYTSNPTAADSGTEVSGGGYARRVIEVDAPSNDATDNVSEIDFGTASANLGTITHYGIRTASSAGNLHVFGEWTTGRQVDNGDDYKVPDGDLDFTAVS